VCDKAWCVGLAPALLVVKCLLAIAIPFILLFFVARTHPLLALGALYGLMLAVLIPIVGYYNYQWKKRDWERERNYGRSIESGPKQDGNSGSASHLNALARIGYVKCALDVGRANVHA
jgi:hypothetical protein